MPLAQIIDASCQRRDLELEQTKNFLIANGYSIAEEDWYTDRTADLILVSTCGFTEAAENCGFEKLKEIEAMKKPGAKVVLGGCIPKINPERVSQEFGGPTFDPQSYTNLNDIINAKQKFEDTKRPNVVTRKSGIGTFNGDIKKAIDIFKSFDGSFSSLERISSKLGNAVVRKVIRKNYAHLESKETFYIQIQEGCSVKCSYCSICTAIGSLRSRPIEAIIEELKNGLEQGFYKIQLMGDNAGSYGLDIGTNMGNLLERISEIEGQFKLDLTDINPMYVPLVSDAIIKLCKQGKLSRLYMPLQSGCLRILRLMRRACNMDKVKQFLIELKKVAPADFRMGTSIIVGFPSETIDELHETINFCRDVDIDWVWCHSFSPRPGTPAAELSDPIPEEEILSRAHLVRLLLKDKALVTTAESTAGSRTCQG
jgi:tRNA A37 methylthiotransferase MiaB